MIERHAFRQTDDRELARAVRHTIPNPDHAADRSDVDNASGAAPQHRRQKSLRHIEDASDVDRKEAIEIGAVRLHDRADVPHAGAVDEDVEAAGIGQHLLRALRALRFIRDVEFQRHGGGATMNAGRRGPRRRFSAVGDVDTRVRGGEGHRDRGADARPGSGDQGDFVGEIEHRGASATLWSHAQPVKNATVTCYGVVQVTHMGL